MDLRILNICNNDCKFCLESGLRNRKPYIPENEIISECLKSEDSIVMFYWGNPLLHPSFEQIIDKLWKRGKQISVMTNTFWLEKYDLLNLKRSWLSWISVFFNSFDNDVHNHLTWWGIALNKVLSNAKLINEAWLLTKFIININALNIGTVYKDIFLLNKLFWVTHFEFNLVFPFEKPWESKELFFDINKKREDIIKLFKVIKAKQFRVFFNKFPKDFFIGNQEYYDFEKWVKNQVWDEDVELFEEKEKPLCYKEKRCKYCFLKEVCSHY